MTTEKNIVIVDSHSGSKAANIDKPFMLVLTPGENLFEAILRCADAAQLKSASISGLGGLDDVTVAYYNIKTKQYQTKLFKGMYELISLNGNITFLDGKRFIHIHATIGTDTYAVFGGHIMDAIVNPSAEITVIPFTATINREFDAGTGLKVMCPIK